MRCDQYPWLDERAAALADYAGVLFDLRDVLLTLRRAIDEGRLSGNDFIAALVLYARPFVEGVRRWPHDEWRATLNDAERDLHQYMLDVRSKHVGHSVNYMEQNVPHVRFNAGGSRATHVVTNRVSVRAFKGQHLEDWFNVAGSARAFVQRLYRAEQERLLPLAQQVPRDELKRASEWRPRLDDPATRSRPIRAWKRR